MNNNIVILEQLEPYIERLEKERKKLSLKAFFLLVSIVISGFGTLLAISFMAFGWIIPITFLGFSGNSEYTPTPPKQYPFIHHIIIFISNCMYGGIFLTWPAIFFVPIMQHFNIPKQISFIKKNRLKDYYEEFKHEIVKNLIKLVNPALNYNPSSHIKTQEFMDSLLLSDDDLLGEIILTGDDLIEGSINNIFIKFSEIQINRLVDGGEDAYKNSNQIWQGLFMIIDLPRNTNTAFGTSNNISNNKIFLDNTEFNELFPVYAENTTEAFYVLPSNLLERMVNFVHKTGRKFDFSVVDDKFYIAIPYNRELLEPPIFKSLFDYSIYEEYLTDLELAIGIVEDLKLA